VLTWLERGLARVPGRRRFCLARRSARSSERQRAAKSLEEAGRLGTYGASSALS
jgi:hypothetical protein